MFLQKRKNNKPANQPKQNQNINLFAIDSSPSIHPSTTRKVSEDTSGLRPIGLRRAQQGERNRKKLGDFGESLVSDYLQQQGFTIKERNYRTRAGEVDIIAAKQNVIIFVEVKLRVSHYFALSEVITASKRKKIIAAAQHFIIKQRLSLRDYVFRFDVALVEQTERSDFAVDYHINAFTQENNNGW